MPYEVDVLVVWVVSFLVVVSVAWLALHGWRQGRTLRRWAAERGLPCRRRGDGRAAARLEPFHRDDEHLFRELDRVREVVELERGGYVVRCEERLDFTPWSSGTAPPRTRVAVVFPVPDAGETYSVFDESGCPTRDQAPGLRFSSGSVCRWLEARLPEPPHPVSLTLAEGWAVAYLLTPSGAVSADELDYLARLARRLTAGGSGLGTAASAAPPAEGRGDGEDRSRSVGQGGGPGAIENPPGARRAADGG